MRNRETSRAGTDGRGEGGNCQDSDVAGRGPVAQETLRYQRNRKRTSQQLIPKSQHDQANWQ